MNENKIKLALRQLSEERIPSNLNLNGWSAIQKRLAQQSARTGDPRRLTVDRKTVLRLVNVAVVVILVIAAAGYFLRPQQTISASQVLMNAIQAQRAGGKLTSYQGALHKQFEGGKIQREEYVWREYPTRRRVESYVNPAPANAVQQLDSSAVFSTPSDKTYTLSTIDVNSDYDHYWYDTRQRGISWASTAPFIQDILVDIGGGMYGIGAGLIYSTMYKSSVQDLLDSLNHRVTDLKLAGTDTIAGRECYVVTMISTNESGQPAKGSKITYWFDKENFFFLKERWDDPAGKLIQEWDFTSISYNPTIDPKVFAFNPSNKALFLDEQGELNTMIRHYDYTAHPELASAELLNADNFAQLIQSIQKQAAYKVFVPGTYTALPGMMPGTPVYESQTAITTIKYQTVNNVMALILFQGPASTMRTFDPCVSNTQCETVSVGDGTGRYFENVESVGYIEVASWSPVQANVRWLSFEKDETYFILRAEDRPDFRNDVVVKADMLKVAASLQPVK